MFPELMIVMAVATTQLDNNSFVVRRRAEKCLTDCGIFAGAHIETAMKSESKEVQQRAEKVWNKMPYFYATYRILTYHDVCIYDFHTLGWEGLSSPQSVLVNGYNWKYTTPDILYRELQSKYPGIVLPNCGIKR